MTSSLMVESNQPVASHCEIRQYQEKDEAAIMDICRRTAHKNAQQEPARTVVPFIFALPYIKLQPDYCWVAESRCGAVVGYVVAVPNSKTYLARIKEDFFPIFKKNYLPELAGSHASRWTTPDVDTDNSTHMLGGNEIERVGKDGSPAQLADALVQRFWHPDKSILHSSWPDLLKEYPAHLHIDILPGYERQGLGTRLMNELKRKLQEDRVPGIHLMKAGDTPEIELFYSKVGFARYPVHMDGGKAGEMGVKDDGGVCMVLRVKCDLDAEI